MGEFLPKDPTQALVDVKERLYDRLKEQKSYLQRIKNIVPFDPYDGGSIDGATAEVQEELEFLENLLDILERS